KETNITATPPETLFRARELALKAGLCFVYTGNVRDPLGQCTYCPQCKQTVIFRNGYEINDISIDEDGCCKYCGQTISGVFDDDF
ncbi:MAG: hypothetical protein ACRC2T_10445, partial [Thermoguttaceae bacterium]